MRNTTLSRRFVTLDPETKGPERLGYNVWLRKRETGLTYADLSDMIGISPMALWKIMRGKSLPFADTLYRLAKALGTTMDALMEGYDG